MGLRKLLLVSIFATVSLGSPLPRPRPQRQQIAVDDVYETYSPGQYTFQSPQQQPQVVRAGPRLVATRNGQVLRTIPRRIRISNPGVVQSQQLQQPQFQQQVQQQQPQFLIPQETYPIDTPNTPVLYQRSPVPVQQVLRAAPQQQQPRYIIQSTPAPVQSPQLIQPQFQQQPRLVSRPLVRVNKAQVPQIYRAAPTPANVNDEEEEFTDEYPADPNPQYNFAFDVKDDELTNYQNRQEERDGQTIKGSYSVVDPDGYVRTVTYTADPKNGFQAKVTREPTDVKVKIPIPTESPEEEAKVRSVVPSYRAQQFAQYPQTVAQYSQNPSSIYSQQSQLASGAYYTNGQHPQYIVRRIPASSLSASSSPRLVRIRQQ